MTGRNKHIACSVVLPALADGPAVHQTLAALAAQALNDPYEVIVVSPVVIDLSACPAARPVHDAGLGPGSALNCGIAAARGDVLAFTDAWCLPDKGWLAAGLASVPNDRLVAGRIVQTPAEPSAATPVEEFELRWSLRQEEDLRRGVASASNLFVHRKVFERVGKFREDMSSKSDWEFCERALDSGFGFTYRDDAVVRHRVIATWAGLWRSKVRLADGMTHLHRARGRGKSAARRDALRQVRPPLRSLAQIVRSDAAVRRKLALAGTVAVSRVAYIAGWLLAELRAR